MNKTLTVIELGSIHARDLEGLEEHGTWERTASALHGMALGPGTPPLYNGSYGVGVNARTIFSKESVSKF